MSRSDRPTPNRFSTTFALMAEFQSAVIPLEIVAVRYLGMSEKKAREKYHRGELPFPVASFIDSQKAPLFVRVEDLADFVDKTFTKARNELNNCKV